MKSTSIQKNSPCLGLWHLRYTIFNVGEMINHQVNNGNIPTKQPQFLYIIRIDAVTKQ